MSVCQLKHYMLTSNESNKPAESKLTDWTSVDSPNSEIFGKLVEDKIFSLNNNLYLGP